MLHRCARSYSSTDESYVSSCKVIRPWSISPPLKPENRAAEARGGCTKG